MSLAKQLFKSLKENFKQALIESKELNSHTKISESETNCLYEFYDGSAIFMDNSSIKILPNFHNIKE